MTRPPYTYAATCKRVIDADTQVYDLDLGFCVHTHTTIRILGWNAPEMSTPEGKRAKVFAEALIGSAAQILVQTEKDTMTFGRYVGRVLLDGEELGELLAKNGLAVPMHR